MKYEVTIDYPSEVMEVEAENEEEAGEKALELIGEVVINAQKSCTTLAEEIKEDDFDGSKQENFCN